MTKIFILFIWFYSPTDGDLVKVRVGNYASQSECDTQGLIWTANPKTFAHYQCTSEVAK